jgi:hypothetical protein
MEMPQKMNDNAKRPSDGASIPGSAFSLTANDDAVRFATGDGEGDESGFEILAYSGEIIPDHWFWGNLGIDLVGMKFAGRRFPVLDSHDMSLRLGYGEGSIGDTITAKGQWCPNVHAQELRADAKAGFPLQASLNFDPKTVRYDIIREGDTAEVNGHMLTGPGTIFRQGVIREISMCVFGEVRNTRSTAFAESNEEQVQVSQIRKDTAMSHVKDEPGLTAETLKAEHGDVYKAVFEAGRTEGSQAEKNRFAALQGVCGEDRELLVTAFAEGRDEAWALKEANGRLAMQLKAAREQLAKPPVGKKPQHDAATQEFLEQPAPQKPGEKNGPATFMEAVKTYQAEFKVSEAEAVRQCVGLHPDLHAKMVNGE